MRTALYFLSDTEFGPVRYVGKTRQKIEKRLKQHKAHSKRQKNHRACWIVSVGDRLHVELIDFVDGDGSAQEIELIKSLKMIGADLVNSTDGGEGSLNFKHTPESKLKMKKARQIFWKNKSSKEWAELVNKMHEGRRKFRKIANTAFN